jgi:endonuclease III
MIAVNRNRRSLGIGMSKSEPKSSRVKPPKRRPDVPLLLEALRKAYPKPVCALRHKSAFELLVATILSAQCTDARVNLVTPLLFERFPDAKSLALAKTEDLEKIIRSTGFFRAKAKSLLGMARGLVEQYDGEVPTDLAALTQLPGVGRKTANVVLGTAFGIPSGVVVDTHVKRLSRRMGLTKNTDPEKIERDLAKVLPQSDWIDFSHRMITHGRAVCKAAGPQCQTCSIEAFCAKIGVNTASND